MRIRFIAYGTFLFVSICIFFLGPLSHKNVQELVQTTPAQSLEEPEEDYKLKLPPVSAERMEELINQQVLENSAVLENEKETFQKHLFNIQNLAVIIIFVFFSLTYFFTKNNADEIKMQPKDEIELIESDEGYHLLSQNINEKIFNV